MRPIFIFAWVFLILILIEGVFAVDDYYCFLKLKDKESVSSVIDSISSNLICKDGKCTCNLKSGEGFCQVCVNSLKVFSSYTNCKSDFCEADLNNKLGLTLSTIFPFEDESVYTKQRFFIDAKTNKKSKIDLIDNIKDNKINLCMHCDSVSKNIFFEQGYNDITIRAFAGNDIKEKRMRFFIDTKKPKITKTSPDSGDYSKGNFTVYYDEESLIVTELNYGLKDSAKSIYLTNCKSGKENSCSANIDLSEYEGQKIEYWFSIKDAGENIILSKKAFVLVDNKPPVINNFSYSADKDYVNFILNINENNLDKILYYYDDKKPKIFCNSLKNNECLKKIKLAQGHHNFKIEAIDKAGNRALKEIELEI